MKNRSRNKNRRSLSPETKYNLKVGFGSLISNNAVIEAGKSVPFWIAIIIGVIGSFLPMVPILTNVSKANGESLINSTYNYSFDRDSAIMSYNMIKENKEVVVTEEKKMVYTIADVEQAAQLPIKITEYTNKNNPKQQEQYKFQAYFVYDFNNKSSGDYISEINGTQYLVGTLNPKSDTDPEGSEYYVPTRIFFYEGGFSISIAKNNSTDIAGSFVGELANVTPQKVIESLAKNTNLKTITSIDDISSEDEKTVLDNYRPILNEAYSSIKSRTMIYSFSIYYSVYVGLTLFLGLLMFLLTRGKRNFNNYLKLHQCMRMSAFSCFTPGLLSLILGFIMPQMGMLFFILFSGLRVMWMSMKQLNPTYGQTN